MQVVDIYKAGNPTFALPQARLQPVAVSAHDRPTPNLSMFSDLLMINTETLKLTAWKPSDQAKPTYELKCECRNCQSVFFADIEAGFPPDQIAGRVAYCPQCASGFAGAPDRQSPARYGRGF